MNKNYPYPIIAKEGWGFIIILALVSVVFLLCGWRILATVFVLLTVFVIQFFRDPYRKIPNSPDTDILSPADGKIVAVEKIINPYTSQDSLKISIFMNVFNVHSNKSPVTGIISKIDYHQGKFLNATLDKASLENERNALLIDTPSGLQITVVQIAGFIARRILCYVTKGDNLSRAQRYGFIRFGSRVDIYLPLAFYATVSIGDKVTGVQSIIAKLNN